MFGNNNISWTPINNLLMAEMKTLMQRVLMLNLLIPPKQVNMSQQHGQQTHHTEILHSNFPMEVRVVRDTLRLRLW
mgnify:CR=1 FL=1